MTDIKLLSSSQRSRITYIDLRLRYVGKIIRQDLISHFGIQSAAATRDISLYKSIAPGNIRYDSKSKSYVVGENFEPIQNYTTEHVLTWLTQGVDIGAQEFNTPVLKNELPLRLSQTSLNVIACISRAIHEKRPIKISYSSINREASDREVVPFTIFDTGAEWRVRGFDRESLHFCDFVISRIKTAILAEKTHVDLHETSACDIQWNRIVELVLVPHPSHQNHLAIKQEYGMSDGKLKLHVRAALAGYMLRQSNIDCSSDHKICAPEYRLWLSDPLVLYGVVGTEIAPGYSST